jgi:hypothetical protein
MHQVVLYYLVLYYQVQHSAPHQRLSSRFPV